MLFSEYSDIMLSPKWQIARKVGENMGDYRVLFHSESEGLGFLPPWFETAEEAMKVAKKLSKAGYLTTVEKRMEKDNIVSSEIIIQYFNGKEKRWE